MTDGPRCRKCDKPLTDEDRRTCGPNCRTCWNHAWHTFMKGMQ